MSAAPVPRADSAYPPAGLDRRFYAGVLDRLVAWPLVAAGFLVAYRSFWRDDAAWAGIAVALAVVLVVGLAFAVAVGRLGSSPGKAAMGLRVVAAGDGTPIGLGAALRRTLVLAVAGLPTFGLGLAALAQTAVLDPGRQRRGWHDRVSGSIVVDVRPPAEVEETVDEGPRQVVNLTAMRLAPAAAVAGAAATPQRRPVAATPPSDPTTAPSTDATAAAPTATTPVTTGPASPPTAPAPVAGGPLGPPLGPMLGPPLAPLGLPSDAAPGPGAAPPPPSVPRAGSSAAGQTVVRGGSTPPPGGGPAWRVTFDTGESFLVDGPALVGRRPEGRPGESIRHLVSLPSEDMSLSKTHAQIQVAADGVLVVMDRGSTNGSLLVRSGVSRELTAGRPATLLPGDTLRLGDRTMTVDREP